MLPMLERVAAELGADRGSGAHGGNRDDDRDRDNGRAEGDGSSGDNGRAKPVTGTRLVAVTTENPFPGSTCPSG